MSGLLSDCTTKRQSMSETLDSIDRLFTAVMHALVSSEVKAVVPEEDNLCIQTNKWYKKVFELRVIFGFKN